tara:strand:+ start:87 stop:311 length:225 start_codon:yes stop_codon:yes gene_type:complete
MDISIHRVKRINTVWRGIEKGKFVRNFFIVTDKETIELSFHSDEPENLNIDSFDEWIDAFVEARPRVAAERVEA